MHALKVISENAPGAFIRTQWDGWVTAHAERDGRTLDLLISPGGTLVRYAKRFGDWSETGESAFVAQAIQDSTRWLNNG